MQQKNLKCSKKRFDKKHHKVDGNQKHHIVIELILKLHPVEETMAANEINTTLAICININDSLRSQNFRRFHWLQLAEVHLYLNLQER